MASSKICAPLDFLSLYPTYGIANIELRQTEAAKALGLEPNGATRWADQDGNLFVIKVQARTHELVSDLSRSPLLEAPVSDGILEDGTWYAKLPFIHGEEYASASPERLYALGVTFREWHANTPMVGRSIDDKSGLSLFLATAHRFKPFTALILSSLFAKACEGLELVPVHGDMAVDHNVFWDKDEICGIIDPYSTAIAPAGVDLAFAASRALASDPQADLTPLFEGYGSKPDRWELILEAVCSRTYVDCVVDGKQEQKANLAAFVDPTVVSFNL